MAAQLEQKPAPASPKYESYVEGELAKVRGRIRVLDAGGFFLVFVVATLGYGFLLILLDRMLDLSTTVRLITFVGYLGIGGYFLVRALLCLLSRVNPYYAARQLEQTLPEAKNSIINWLDLRDEKLSPVIRNSLGLRAAKDLKQADAEQAVNSRLPLLLGASVMALCVGLLVLFVMDNHRFGDLLGRVFAPFREIQLGTRTTIALLEPEGGDVAVPLNRAVRFRADIGNAPAVSRDDAPRLLYRYNDAEPYDPRVSVALEQDRDGTWIALIPPDQVQTGFSYKISAGDAETPEYRVVLLDAPRVTRYEATYHYRPYRKVPDQSIVFPNDDAANPYLVAHRGTEVALIARTNRKLKQSQVQFEVDGVRQERAGEVLAVDPQAVKFKFVMEKTGTFRVLFRSEDGEENSVLSFFKMDVFTDEVPHVELTKPAKDMELPANGTLPLEGVAKDDFGITAMTLRMRVLPGKTPAAASLPELAPKRYRDGKKFELIDGTYPRKLDYQDFVALDQVKTVKDKAFPLAKGMVLEYWLEATDNSDYPDAKGNVSKSKSFKVTILDPDKDQQRQKQDRRKAERDRRNHNQKQDQQLAKENEQKQGGGNSAADKLRNERDKLQNDAKELKKAAEQKEREQKQKGEAKGGDPKKGQAKSGENSDKKQGAGEKMKNQKPGADNQAGQQKDQGQNAKSKKAEAKDEGKKQDKKNNPGQSKGGSGQSGAGAKGDKGNKRADPSAESKGSPGADGASAKDGGAKSDSKNAGQAKSGAPQGMSGDSAAAQKKEAGKDPVGGQAKNAGGPEASDKDRPAVRAETKPGPNDQVAEAKGAPKDNPKQAPAGASKSAEPKSSEPKLNDPSAGPQGKPGEAKGDRAEPKRAEAKDGEQRAGGNEPRGGAKGAGANKDGPQAQPKKLDSSQAQGGGHARDGGQPPDADDGKTLDEALKDLAKDPAKLKAVKDIKDQADKLKGQDQKTRKDAADELKKLAEESDDPAVQDIAKKLVEEFKESPQAKDDGANPQGPKQPSPDGAAKSAGDKKDQPPAEVKMDRKQSDTGTAKTEAPGKKQESQAKANGERLRPFGQAGTRPPTEFKPLDPNEEYGKHAGDLNLEDFKKKIKENPKFLDEVLKESGWTKDRLERWLRDVEAYNRELAKYRARPSPNNAKGNASGGNSQLTGSSSEIRGTNNQNPAQVNRPDVPPEYRDLYRYFTSPDAAPPKK